MMTENNELTMRFSLSTIEHLGVRMYSQTPPALAELVANAYDACAKTVNIRLHNTPEHKIEVEDDGSGMTFEEVNNFFLIIGRNRRKEGQESTCERKPTGKKGLGKLALFGLGNKITVITKKNNEEVKFILDYEAILRCDSENYNPSHVSRVIGAETGTKIILEELHRKTNYNAKNYADHIARLFNFKDENFKIRIGVDNEEPIEVDAKSKYSILNEQFSWKFEEIEENFEIDFEYKNQVKGVLYTTERPLPASLKGITLFANGRMVNSPEFFGGTASNFFYSYLTGRLDVDFIDDELEDYISTNRQSLNWDRDITIKLKEYLREFLISLEELWRDERRKLRKRKFEEKTSINLKTWLGNVGDDFKEKPIDERLEKIVVNVIDSELPLKKQNETLENLRTLLPEYCKFHWRGLHSIVQDASKCYYQSNNFHAAFNEAVKKYCNEVKEKSSDNIELSDRTLMEKVFGKESKVFGKDSKKGKLSVCARYKKAKDCKKFLNKTFENIEEGQKLLSMGIVAGGRNPLAHEEVEVLKKLNIISEKDCLDLLSLLSHLMLRLENAELIQ